MADEEESEVVKYVYEGSRASGEVLDVTAGAAPKELTKPLELLGVREGVGKATFPNGDLFEGCFEAGSRSGAGTYTYAAPPPEEGEEPAPPTATYEGAFKAGVKAGVGTLTWASGAKFQGTFKDGKYHGQGTMFYPNGDIYSGAWVAGQKDGQGSYIYKETKTTIKGTWVKNILMEGIYSDQYGNTYTGEFAASTTGVRYLAGGAFNLASGASDAYPKPTGLVWTMSYGNFGMLQCKDAPAAALASAAIATFLATHTASQGGVRATALGQMQPEPSKGYPPMMALDASKVMWLEQFKDVAAYHAHKSSARLAGCVPDLLRYGASGAAADFGGSLECEMVHLEKPGAASGANYVRIVGMKAKEASMIPMFEDVIKGEVTANMDEPGFVRGTVLRPTTDEPCIIRWVMQWTSKEECEAHVTYPHHRNTELKKIFPMVDMSGFGGALEWAGAVAFEK